MGLSLDSLPLVLQFNKRDLSDVLSVDELNRSLNRANWAWFEASAVNGKGVLETLKGVSKLTLLSLRQRLARSVPPGERPILPGAETARPARPPARPASAAAHSPAPAPSPPPPKAAAPRPAAPAPSVVAAARPAPPRTAPAAKRPVDALSELERLRREAMRSSEAATPPPAAPRGGTVARPAPAARPATPANGHGQLFRDIQLTLKRADFERARRFTLSLQVEDGANRVVDAIRGLEVEFDDPSQLEQVLLKLNIALHSKD
jgi:hypothetical protein